MVVHKWLNGLSFSGEKSTSSVPCACAARGHFGNSAHSRLRASCPVQAVWPSLADAGGMAVPRPATPVWHDGRRRVHVPAGISTDSRRNVPHLGYGRSGFRALVVGMVLRLMGRPEGGSAGVQAWRAVSAGQTPVRANILPLVRRNAGLWERGTRTQRPPDRTESDGI